MKFFLFLKQVSIVLILCTVLLLSVQAESAGRKRLPSVKEGNHVYIEYTLKLEDGEVVDSNVGSDPMNFIHGKRSDSPGTGERADGNEKGREQRGSC